MPSVKLPSYDLPIRLADIDFLHHVNAAVHVDYAIETQAMLRKDGLLAATEPVSRVSVHLDRPLSLSGRPIIIASERDGMLVTHEICHEVQERRTVFARVEMTFGAHQTLGMVDPTDEQTPAYPLHVRRSDLGAGVQVTLPKLLGLIEEARKQFLSERLGQVGAVGFVVAQVDVDLGPGIGWRREPYASRSWITNVQASSCAVITQIIVERVVHARARTILAGFDVETQSLRPLTGAENERLLVRRHCR